MTSPLQDAAAALTSSDRAVLIVATHAEEGPAYITQWLGDEFDGLTDDAARVSKARTDMALGRVQSEWPQVVV